MDVRAKMQLTEKNNVYIDGSKSVQSTVKLVAVINGSEENKTWARYTPSGSIQLVINNQSAVEAFELGAEYIVTFTKVEPALVEAAKTA